MLIRQSNSNNPDHKTRVILNYQLRKKKKEKKKFIYIKSKTSHYNRIYRKSGGNLFLMYPPKVGAKSSKKQSVGVYF